MRMVFYLLSIGCVIALAFWAYSENYRTQAALKDVQKLHRDIAAANARLGVLRAEWAYLSRPDRLRDLAELNFDRLGLHPLAPEQFGTIDQIAFPSKDIVLPLTEPVEVMEREARQGDQP